MSKSTVTICLPAGVWERCKARVGVGKSNSEVGRQIVLEWLARAEIEETSQGTALLPPDPVAVAIDSNAGHVLFPLKYPVVYKWERPA